MKLLSVIMPVLDEQAEIVDALTALAPLRRRGVEIVVVDGGSSDDTVTFAHPLCDLVLAAPRGRAVQMNTGAEAARGDVLLFLHADTRLPADADRIAIDALSTSGRLWGRFDVAITGAHVLLPVIAAMMNLRSRVTGIATGDQAVFCTRTAFDSAGGYPAIALMEDIVLSRRLKRVSRAVALDARVLTSGRRWVKHGVARTILLMWGLRLAFLLGVSPEWLAERYAHARRNS
jgi:rSAM/selenodomain-associated transferase 2